MAGLSWWPEIHRSFQVSLTPTLVAKGTTNARAALILTPAFAFTGRSHMHASFALSPTVAIGFVRLSYPGAASLTLTPAIAMAGKEHYRRSFSLSLPPTITMGGAPRVSFALTLTPSIGIGGVQHNKQFPYVLPFNVA